MLFDAMSGKRFDKVPYVDNHERLKQLSPEELDAAKDELNEMIEGDEIHTAGWMPGNDWTGTPFQPIFKKAAHKDYDLAAKIFGLLVFEVFMSREDKWFTLRAEKDGEPIGSRTYFKSKKLGA